HAIEMRFLTMDMEGGYKLMKAISRTRIPDDIRSLSNAWEVKQDPLPVTHAKIPVAAIPEYGPDEPELRVAVEVSANTENELNAKISVIEEMVNEELKDVKMIGPQFIPSAVSRYPLQVLGVLSSGGGLTWVGTYGPMSKWLETAEKGTLLQDKYGFTRSCYTRVMREGHFVALRWLLPFNKEDPEEVEKIRLLSLEQLDMAIEMGYIPYKTPVWAIRKIEERADPNLIKLQRRVKEMLDPNNIMNPGRWGAPQE
ncbi:MAG: FAD-linked oxidase C-terminal domain-containing protein, partial [Chloroflexota bacterium]